jgi:hypothetical protein
VRAFLAGHIDSIAQLEALLLLRSMPGTTCDTKGIARRLYIGEREAEETLVHLAAHGFLAGDANGYRFGPQSEELSRMVELLADCYRRHLIPITNLIHAKPRRIRQFADAFKLKKD